MNTDSAAQDGAATAPPPSGGVEPSLGMARFGEVEVDLDTGELWRGGEPRPLRPQATRALQLLVRNRHRMVSRGELRRHLWGDAVLEWEAGLYQVIRQLRRALDDDAAAGCFIATVSRRGYRWSAPETRPSRIPWKGAGLFLAGAGSLVLTLLLVCLLAALVP